jgi:hypothetical protein
LEGLPSKGESVGVLEEITSGEVVVAVEESSRGSLNELLLAEEREGCLNISMEIQCAKRGETSKEKKVNANSAKARSKWNTSLGRQRYQEGVRFSG